MLNDDYKDILLALSEQKAEFILVGAYAIAVHGYPRSTMDIDLWIKPDPRNALSVLRALEDFGAPSGGITAEALEDKLMKGINTAGLRQHSCRALHPALSAPSAAELRGIDPLL